MLFLRISEITCIGIDKLPPYSVNKNIPITEIAELCYGCSGLTGAGTEMPQADSLQILAQADCGFQ